MKGFNMLIISHTAPPAHSVAWHLGRLDASNGVMACPELLYADRPKQVEYCEGYASFAGPTLTTEQFLSQAEIDADTDDYESDMLDREYHARGGW
jgi:hypothetical protein